MIKFQPIIKGAVNLQNDLKAERPRQKKALATAIKVEGFRLRNLLKKQIRAGAPGGLKFTDQSMINRKRTRRKNALSRLAPAVRYHIPKSDPIEMRIGWTGPKVSKSWKRIAEKQQAGFSVPISDSQRRFFVRYGSSLGKRTKARKFFFLRKSTTQMDTPSRPIIEPFWDQQRMTSGKRISVNFRKKLRGERI